LSSFSSFVEFFQQATRAEVAAAGLEPHDWQRDLGAASSCSNRRIRIPTGFGKTLGVLAAWTWNRVARADTGWPNRLVWCLPMRVLVEQTEQEVRAFLGRLGLLWDGQGERAGRVGVHLLMGGADAGDWHLHPEHPAVLIGTQDMLLSRALNRGYGSARARWPMEFGLLNQDCLWVLDEVQLMDVGLATSAQLQAFREDDAARSFRPCRTWWMSATLQEDWLQQSPDTQHLVEGLQPVEIAPAARQGHLWDDVAKPCRLEPVKDAKALTKLVAEQHAAGGAGAAGPTLVVVNTVERARELAAGLQSTKSLTDVDIRLVHSRFRPAERARWARDFLNRQACAPGTNRILVTTQVVEAGVDVSAGVLITELAPWASLVQRFGRCARWGGTATVTVADLAPKDDKAAAPYAKAELDAAREALAWLADVAPRALEAFEESHPELLPALYPYEPLHLLLRHELDELFDTSPDLSGADIDVSRFIRSGDERDVTVFWEDVPPHQDPPRELRPSRAALCPVPFLKARDWLCGTESGSSRAPRLKPDKRAWVWDWLDGRWRWAERRDLYPGQTVLVEASCGGYDPQRGWQPEGKSRHVEPVAPVTPTLAEQADAAQDDESLSAYRWQTIAVHGREVGAEASRLATQLCVTSELAALLDLAGRWHDVGKAHPAFAGSIRSLDRPDRLDLAKAPATAWLPRTKLYPMPNGRRRRGFRHELASTLALFAVLQRHAPDHAALLGPWRELLAAAELEQPPASTSPLPANELEQEILALDAASFDLLAYLVCAHHGKVRLTWHACPADQDAADPRPRVKGVCEGDELPSLTLVTAGRTFDALPSSLLGLSLARAGLSPHTGPSWTERTLGLLAQHGPFGLAWLEALLRVADQRVSSRNLPDELLGPASEVCR